METEILFMLLLKTATIMLMGAICALFSYLLDYTFWPGSIFGKYQPWLAETLLKRRFPDEWAEVRLLPLEAQEDNFMDRAQKIFLFKVMGGCIVCTNVWIGFISWACIMAVSCYYNVHFHWLYGFPYVLTSSAVLRKLLKQ